MHFSILYDQTMLYSCFRFLNINFRFPGSTHDTCVMSNSNIPGIMANLSKGGWLLGDSGYRLKDFLMTSFNTPSTQMEGRYNLAHCQTRKIIEKAFDVLKSRFRHVIKYQNIKYIFHYILFVP